MGSNPRQTFSQRGNDGWLGCQFATIRIRWVESLRWEKILNALIGGRKTCPCGRQSILVAVQLKPGNGRRKIIYLLPTRPFPLAAELIHYIATPTGAHPGIRTSVFRFIVDWGSAALQEPSKFSASDWDCWAPTRLSASQVWDNCCYYCYIYFCCVPLINTEALNIWPQKWNRLWWKQVATPSCASQIASSKPWFSRAAGHFPSRGIRMIYIVLSVRWPRSAVGWPWPQLAMWCLPAIFLKIEKEPVYNSFNEGISNSRKCWTTKAETIVTWAVAINIAGCKHLSNDLIMRHYGKVDEKEFKKSECGNVLGKLQEPGSRSGEQGKNNK